MQEDYKQKVINFFNSRTTYDSEGKSHPEEAKRLLEFVPVQSGQTILDIATGTGLVAIPVAQAVAPEGSVIGVDMSAGMLAQAKVKIVAEGINNLKLIDISIILLTSKNRG
jgi:ubiquinone/menaquinone biosynthesis C-methylase UbiE